MCHTRMLDIRTGEIRWFASNVTRQLFRLPKDLEARFGVTGVLTRKFVEQLGYREHWQP